MLQAFLAGNIKNIFFVIGMAMLPVVELRGAIPFATGLGFPIQEAFLWSIIGNMIPVPFILLLIRKIFAVLREVPRLAGLIERLERKAHLQGAMVKKYRLLGLCLLVAIPLPGTGAWTGALVAGLLEIRLRDSLITIFLGVCIAGLLVSLATMGVIALF